MGDRRILLGTSAVLVGVGSALISGTGVAAADTVDSDTGGSASTTSANMSTTSTPGTKARRAVTRAKAASGPPAAADPCHHPQQHRTSPMSAVVKSSSPVVGAGGRRRRAHIGGGGAAPARSHSQLLTKRVVVHTVVGHRGARGVASPAAAREWRRWRRRPLLTLPGPCSSPGSPPRATPLRRGPRHPGQPASRDARACRAHARPARVL